MVVAIAAVGMGVLAVVARAAEIRRAKQKVHTLRARNRELEQYVQPATGQLHLLQHVPLLHQYILAL